MASMERDAQRGGGWPLLGRADWSNIVIPLVLVLGTIGISWVQTSTHLNDVAATTERRLDHLEAKADAAQLEIAEVSERLTGVESSMQFILAAVDRIEVKLDAVTGQVNDVSERVARLEAAPQAPPGRGE